MKAKEREERLSLRKFRPDDDLKNVEYIRVSRDGKEIHTFGPEVNGWTKVDLQKKVGELFGTHLYHCSAKIKGLFKNQTFQIRGIKLNHNSSSEPLDENIILKERINALEIELHNKSRAEQTQVFDPKIIESVISQKFEIEINYLKRDIETLKKDIKDRDEIIKQYENEIDKINKDNGDSSNLLGLLMNPKNLASVFGGKISNVSDSANNKSTNNHVPQMFKDFFESFDYEKISADEQNNFLTILKQFTEKLPKKERQ